MAIYSRYYFLGIGGIGMSALARYFNTQGLKIAGYDRTPSVITKDLEAENIQVVFDESVAAIPLDYLNPETTLVILTPAIPEDNPQLCFFEKNKFTIQKRAEVLGEITRQIKAICIAGTHGKTTTSTIAAHLLYQSHISCSAFLGGIANNYNSNLLLSNESNFVVVEADEYDRSFYHLSPYMAVITSVDPDHLDIYKTPKAYKESFEHFTSLIRPGGALILRTGLDIEPKLQKGVKLFSYSMDDGGDFQADNIRYVKGEMFFDFVTPTERIADVRLGVPIRINIENSVAAMAIAWINGITQEELRTGIASFSGVYRRFNVVYKNDDVVLMDDYAHHPKELSASIRSIKDLYPDKKITGIFQPHLYSRTRDFSKEFAESLSLLDELILLDIYPAREEPIKGVTSRLILDDVKLKNKTLCSKENLLPLLENKDVEVLVTLGAGDIELLVPLIKELLKKKKRK